MFTYGQPVKMLLRIPTNQLPVVRLLSRGNICHRRVQRQCVLSVRRLVTHSDHEQYYTLPVSFQTRTPGERMTIDVGVRDVHPVNMTPSTPLVVTAHGVPGSSQDFDAIGRQLAGHGVRVVGLDFPGFGKSRLLGQDVYRLDHSTEGKSHMLITILDALAISRVDVLIGHSAGTWLNYKAAADLHLVKSSVLLNPLGKRHHRTLRPFILVKLLGGLMRNPVFHSILYKCLPFIYKVLGFVLEEDTFPSLPIAVESVRYSNFDKMQAYAETAAAKKHPFVMAITRNDKIGEWNFAVEMAQHLEIEEGEITEFSNNNMTVGDNVGKYDDSCYRRVLLFERGGHLVHRAHEKEVVKHILQLLKVVSSHDS
ncbi:uncharacterized protein LOC110449091 [Mizuhopecten yessoensis]|uniref:uncharacterized protein LOC110449091 n=1 Tax=Mizuhopecten yessoensis TaxID=6573 RepID=UPI000B45AB25|nr:uncharacterized protein LOC110449091 [Mizuhopecten yessoensis]